MLTQAPTPEQPFDLVSHAGQEIKVETCAEIIAKKMWHRGDRARARDLYDLCAVAEAEPEAIDQAAPFLAKHGRLSSRNFKSARSF
jgi:predicted nucleotidyltransferase component of viral defense system